MYGSLAVTDTRRRWARARAPAKRECVVEPFGLKCFSFVPAPGFGAWPRSSNDSRRRLPVSNTVARPLAGGWVQAG